MKVLTKLLVTFASIVLIFCKSTLFSGSVFNVGWTRSQSSVKQITNIINGGIRDTLKFELPTSAKTFEAPEEPVKDFGCYDFVIVGGGTAGSVLASRLSEIENLSVLVLEAGNFTQTNGFNQFVRFFLPFLINTPLNWGFRTTPQTTACLGYENESCLIPRGIGVGGSSLINAGAYSRGNPENYDHWANITQDPSWSYKNILKYFKKSETFHWTNKRAPVDLQYHGTSGPIQVQHRIPDFFLSDTFVRANKKFGIHATDYNGPKQLGTSFFQLYTKNGTREDMGSVFLKPFLKRTNLNVAPGTYVTKIHVNKITKEAESVLFTYRGGTYRVRARKEVILSAGAISSPHILMLSGIGPKSHLRDLGIDVIENLEVGSKIFDHPSVTLRISSNITSEETLNEQVTDYLDGKGTLTAPTLNQALGFYNFNGTDTKIPNIEILNDIFQRSEEEIKLLKYKPEVYNALWGNNGSHVSYLINNIAPESKGTLRLKSKSPYDYPLIDLALLSDSKNKDLEAIYQGIEFLLKLVQTQDYQKYGLQYLAEPLPPCQNMTFKSREYWYCYIRQTTQTFFHIINSCPMGGNKESGAVVDSNLQVFGVSKLRVVDTSVFPSTISGHTSMPVVMVAEKMADVIKLKYLT